MSFSIKDRQQGFDSLPTQPPEVLILGGGVVGCSIAAHLAEMQIPCALIEREDLATGASGNSTGLAHAGLRYLAQGQILYVFKESRERARIEQLAPHWVRPFNFLYPVYKNDPFGLSMVRLGTWIYDLMAWADALITHRSLPKRHRIATVDELVNRIPGLKTAGLEGATEYFVDARLQDARFTLGWAQRAAEHGARVLTYTEVSGFHSAATEPQRLTCKDRLSGAICSVEVPLVINATGAWIDGVRSAAGFQNPTVTPRQGIHLIVDQIASSPLIFSGEPRGRVFFVIPLGTKLSIVGTTDIPCRSLDPVIPQGEEILDLIRHLFHFFPYLKQGSNFQQSVDLYKQVHVRDLFWGVRPLVRQTKPTADPSRDHALVKDSNSFWSIAGVKLTAARRAGAEVSEAVWKARRKGRPPLVAKQPLPGGDLHNFDAYVQDAKRRFPQAEETQDLVGYLVSQYGTRYAEVLRYAAIDPRYGERLMPDEPWILAQPAYAAQEEMCLTLNDFVWRRAKWAHYRDLPQACVEKIAQAMAGTLQWSKDDIRQQLDDYAAEVQKHRVSA